jgi:hypothetical protein
MQVHFVTKQEARRANAVKHNKPRELNQVEKILLAGIELSKKPKYDIDELKQLCNLMLDTTGGDRLADKLKEAVNDPVAMQSLIEVYPQVEFHDAIKGGVESLNGFERLYYINYSMSSLVGMANVISILHAYLLKFPKGLETFLYTEFTSLHALRAEWEGDKKQTKYLGYALPLLQQRALREITLEPRYKGSIFGTIIEHGMLNNPELWRRTQKAPPVSDFVLSYEKNSKFSTNGYILVATNKKTATTLYFCV